MAVTKLQKTINALRNPGGGVKLTGMTMLCGCKLSPDATGKWIITAVGASCTQHKAGE